MTGICALPSCVVFAGGDPPTDPDEAWRLASGRELKVGRELRCHAVHRELGVGESLPGKPLQDARI
jgi:hypothetical protein